MTTIDACEMAQVILHLTDDGDELADQDHLLVLRAVNGTLTNEGYDAFVRLYERVVAGTYRKEAQS